MKTRMLMLAAVAAAAAIAGLAPGAAEARGYTCNYKFAPGVVATVDGNDNTPVFCRLFSGDGFAPRVASHPVRSYCGWAARSRDVRVVLYATSSVKGRQFCTLLASKIDRAKWRRIF